MVGVKDTRGRPLRDLRISVTDRCNMRCRYCMPREVFGSDFAFLSKIDILTYEEIDRLAGLFISLGVEKVRLSGGEPLLRKDLHELISMLALRDVEIAMTTNGVLLPRYAPALSAAGLDRVTVSLDALDEATFAAITDSGHTVAAVLAGIEAAESVGLGPIKVNTVVKRGVNEDEILDLVKRFSSRDIATRFIEYMDVGTTNGWAMGEVVTADEIRNIISELQPLESQYHGEVAKRYRLPQGGEVGLITSVTEPFCGDCTRARLSADGHLYTCLFASQGLDLLTPMREGASDEDLLALIETCWIAREDRYSEIRTEESPVRTRVEMSYIGGYSKQLSVTSSTTGQGASVRIAGAPHRATAALKPASCKPATNSIIFGGPPTSQYFGSISVMMRDGVSASPDSPTQCRTAVSASFPQSSIARPTVMVDSTSSSNNAPVQRGPEIRLSSRRIGCDNGNRQNGCSPSLPCG